MNPLTALPPRVRQVFYVVAAFVGLFLGACQAYDADTLFGAVDVDKALQVLGYVSGVLGLTAAANMPSAEDVIEGDAPPPDDLGHLDVGQAVLIALLVVLLLVVLGIAWPQWR